VDTNTKKIDGALESALAPLQILDNFKTALDAGKDLASIASRTMDIQGIPHALVPNGYSLKMLSEAVDLADRRAEREKPRLLQGNAVIGDEPSFIAHLNRFKDSDSVIFATDKSFTAVYDYHRPVSSGPARNEGARFGKHRAVFAPEMSPEWLAWIGGSGKVLDQESFADFLEEHVQDIAGPIEGRTVPSPAALASLALNLKVMADDTMESTLNRTTGEYTLVAKREQKTVGNTVVFPEFDIEIPIFTGGVRYRIVCKLRLRKTDSGYGFAWAVPGASALKRKAMTEVGERVSKTVSLPLIVGQPE